MIQYIGQFDQFIPRMLSELITIVDGLVITNHTCLICLFVDAFGRDVPRNVFKHINCVMGLYCDMPLDCSI